MRIIYDFPVKNGKGNDVSLEEYANEVLLIVNAVAKCGFTPQHKELEKLHEKYYAKGLETLDFPRNQFGQQAPGTDENIHESCRPTYGTKFSRLKKIKVNGDNADPSYKPLKEQRGFVGWNMSHPIAPVLVDIPSKGDPDYEQKPNIRWNFVEFFINKQGQAVACFELTERSKHIAQ